MITPRKTTGFADPHDENRFARYVHPYEENRYYESHVISEVMRVEKIIQQSDSTDLSIIHGLINGKTYDALAEELFLNRNAIDYRVQKLKKIAEKDNVADLRKMLLRFLGKSR